MEGLININTQYSAEFKLEAIKMIEKSGEPLTKVAKELGVKPTIMQGWYTKYKNSPVAPFPSINPEEPIGLFQP